MVTREKAKEKYNVAVKKNLLSMEKETDDYIDPDEKSGYFCTDVEGIQIYMVQDGLCSIKTIKEFAPLINREGENEVYEPNKRIMADYQLLREGMFDVLVWPGYAMSINALRRSKYKDRLDLLLIDIEKFYKTVHGRKIQQA